MHKTSTIVNFSQQHDLLHTAYNIINILKYPQIHADIHILNVTMYLNPDILKYLHFFPRDILLVVIHAIVYLLQHANRAINCSWKFNSINPFMCIGWHHTRADVTLSLFGSTAQTWRSPSRELCDMNWLRSNNCTYKQLTHTLQEVRRQLTHTAGRNA